MGEAIKAGKPYRPSNGLDGIMFMEQFCERCKHDEAEEGCYICWNAMLFSLDDPEYPTEWTHDDEGRPTCTAFEPKEQDDE